MVEYESEYRLVRIARPRVQGMTRKRIGGVTIYTRRRRGDEHLRFLDVFAERGGVWYRLRKRQGPPLIGAESYTRPETERPPVVTPVKRSAAVVRVSWIEQWMGANRAGLTRRTVLLDFRAKPRVLLAIDCSDAGGGGACTAPDAAHSARNELTCDEDLRCTMRQTVNLDWARRSATRRFDLLTNATLPLQRFDTETFASGAAFAAIPGAVRRRALIEGIGLVQPVHEVSPGTVLFAAHTRAPVAGFRFFLLDRGKWREISQTLLADSGYPGADAEREQADPIDPAFTPDSPQLILSAWDLGLPGRRKLIEVVGTEGTARSVHWIMIDPAGRTGALRVATNHPEWRHCGDVVYPVTASWLGIPDRGLPAIARGIASWRKEHVPRTCALTGTIDWSAQRGWIVRLAQAPCTDPGPRPLAVTISEEGDLRADPVSFSQ